MRAHLQLDSADVQTPGLHANDVGNLTKRTEGGLFHLILVLRVIDIAMFYGGKGVSASPLKIHKCLTSKASSELLASTNNILPSCR